MHDRSTSGTKSVNFADTFTFAVSDSNSDSGGHLSIQSGRVSGTRSVRGK